MISNLSGEIENAAPRTAAPRRVLVLGGGFTGLRTAFLLHRLGHRVAVVEREAKLGGMVATFERNFRGHRFLFDFGPHLFFKEYLEEYRALVGSDMLTLTDRFTMCVGGTVLSYPPRPAEMFLKMGPLRSAAYVFDYLAGKALRPFQPQGPSSLDESLSRRFGKKLFRDFYEPYIVKCCGLAVGETDIQWARERENVSGRSLASNLLNKIRAACSAATRARLRSSNDPAASEITAWYPRHGSGQLCDAMAAGLDGAEIHLETAVESITLGGGGVRSVSVSKAGRRFSLEADLVVSTIPLPGLASLLDPPDIPAREAASSLRYRTVRLVNLIVDKPRALDSLELFSMDPSHLFKRVYEPKAMSPEMAPPDMTSLCLEVCCTAGDAVSNMGEEEIASSCVASLCGLGVLDSPAQVLDSFVLNMPWAYPIYHKGFENARSCVLGRIAQIPNLITCGRQGIFRYHSMTNEVMETADSIVRFVESGSTKADADNRRSPWGQSFY